MILRIKNTVKTTWFVVTEAGVVPVASVYPPDNDGDMLVDVPPGSEVYILSKVITNSGQEDHYYRTTSTHGMKTMRDDTEISKHFGLVKQSAVAPSPLPVVEEAPVKRKRGRPRKETTVAAEIPASATIEAPPPIAPASVVPKGRKLVIKMRMVTLDT